MQPIHLPISECGNNLKTVNEISKIFITYKLNGKSSKDLLKGYKKVITVISW